MYATNPLKTSSGKTVKSVTSISVNRYDGTTDYFVTRYYGTGRVRMVVAHYRYATLSRPHPVVQTFRFAQSFGSLPTWLQYIMRSLEGKCVSLTLDDYCTIYNHVNVRYPKQRLIPAGNWFDYDFLTEICNIEGVCV